MDPCYVKFRVASKEQFDRLALIVAELRKDKEAGEFRSDDEWRKYFSAEELNSFRNPTKEELADWERRWFATPVEQRDSDPTLKTPWDFGSMFDAIRNGEYSLLGVRSDDMEIGFVEFDPQADPFGSSGGLQALIHAYGHKLIGYDDGFGFEEVTDAF